MSRFGEMDRVALDRYLTTPPEDYVADEEKRLDVCAACGNEGEAVEYCEACGKPVCWRHFRAEHLADERYGVDGRPVVYCFACRPRTRAEVEDLKRGWRADPCWDLADTEGFEPFREELEAYQREMEARWAREHEEATAAREAAKAAELGVALRAHVELVRYVLRLESRLDGLAERLTKLEED